MFACVFHHFRELNESIVSPEHGNDTVRLLRERRPNASNRAELLEMLRETYSERRAWIEDKKTSITEILRLYPRFQDMDVAVSVTRTVILLFLMLFGFEKG